MAATSVDQPGATDRLLAVTLRAQPGWFAVAALTGLFSATGQLLLPTAMGRALDAALGRGALVPAVALLAAVVVVATVADVLGQIAGTAGVAGTTAWLRRRVLGNLLGLGMRGRDAYPAGDAVTRLIAGASATGRIVSLVLAAVQVAVTALVALVLLFLLDWSLPVTLLGGLLVSLALLRPFTRQATSAFAEYQEVQGRIANRLVDALAGMRTIRASGTVDREVDRVLEPLPTLRAAGIRTWLLQRRLAWSFGLLIRLLQLTVLAAAGLALSAGRLTPGDLVAAVGYAGIALQAIEQIDLFVELVQVRAGADRVRPLTGAKTVAAPTLRMLGGPGELELRDVTVRVGDRTLLDGCSLRVAAGTTTAVVGASGAGKSVLVGLFGRVTEPDHGAVLVDGRPVDEVPEDDLRRTVGYAFERPALVGTTVADAIGYGRRNPAGDARCDVADAARAALVHTVVDRLPDGYATPVQDVPLSGGERQRLGLARLVAAAPRVLVLDDAMSSLDTATEVELQAALTRTLPGRTRVVVTHRARAAAQADQVVWLDRGRIRRASTHAELWRDADYRALFGDPASSAEDP